MSTLLSTVRRSMPALLLVHALQTVWTLGLLAPLHGAVSTLALEQRPATTMQPADVAVLVELFARRGPALLPWTVSFLVGFALLAPALALAWLHTMHHPGNLATSVWTASKLGVRAVAVRCSLVLAFGVAATLGVVTMHLGLSTVGEAGELPLRALCLAFCAVAALICATLHDLGLAALAHQPRSMAACLRAAATHLTLARVFGRAASLTAATAFLALADLSTRHWTALPAQLSVVAATVASHGLLLLALTARALWLAAAAHAIATTVSPPKS